MPLAAVIQCPYESSTLLERLAAALSHLRVPAEASAVLVMATCPEPASRHTCKSTRPIFAIGNRQSAAVRALSSRSATPCLSFDDTDNVTRSKESAGCASGSSPRIIRCESMPTREVQCA
jgi:hypothetical protein